MPLSSLRGRSGVAGRSRHTIVIALALASFLAMLAPAPSAHAAALPDGLTSANAAPSCWAIKQAYPASADGQYWLQTPTLITAQKFYCDMTTDGGGWVLVGRGRDGWTFDHNGQGSAGTVRGITGGTTAFAPAALSATTIDGVLDGARPDELEDGIRIRRAKNKQGTSWQEVRWHISTLDSWSWGFPGGYLLDETVIDGQEFQGGNTNDSRTLLPGQVGPGTGSDNGELRLYTWFDRAHNNRGGFSYGESVQGESSSTSYLWQFTNEKRAIAFTQVFIRPKITSVSYPTMPDEGLPAQPLPPLLNSSPSLSTPWGVTGTNPTTDNITKSPALALAQVGDTMFVGGKFRNVQQGASGSPVVQSWLAGFDVNTGEWRSGFRPELNGTVWDLMATPDGDLLVAGEFTSVNGSPMKGLAKLDPVTGEVDPSWFAEVENVLADGTVKQFRVKALEMDATWLYVGGDFTKMRGGTDPASFPRYRLGRVRLDTGAVDNRWKPRLDSRPMDLDIGDAGDRMYLAGNFTMVNGVSRKHAAAVTIPAGALVTGLQPYQPSSSGAQYQQAIQEVGDVVVQGGAQHNLHFYDRTDYDLLQSHITKKGGDFQAIGVVDGVVYATCHCNNWNYEGTNVFSTPAGYERVDQIQYIGAYDADTMRQIREFQPVITSGLGTGPWDLTEDTNGCMWFAGDFSQGAKLTSGGRQWLGSFGKMCPRDSQAPSTPGSFTAQRSSATRVTLQWAGSTDNGGSVLYEVLRDGRVIATVSGLTYSDNSSSAGSRYAVRGIDPLGNRSATSPALAA